MLECCIIVPVYFVVFSKLNVKSVFSNLWTFLDVHVQI